MVGTKVSGREINTETGIMTEIEIMIEELTGTATGKKIEILKEDSTITIEIETTGTGITTTIVAKDNEIGTTDRTKEIDQEKKEQNKARMTS